MSSSNKKDDADDGSNNNQDKNSTTRLTSLLPAGRGGLQPKKAPSDEQQQHRSSNTRASLLGLDRLAATKRQERNYRHRYDETPSHPGGINRQVQARARERDGRQRYNRSDYNNDTRRSNNEQDDRKRSRRRYDSDDDDNDNDYDYDRRRKDRRRDDDGGGERRPDDRRRRRRDDDDDDRYSSNRRGDRYSERRPRDSERRPRESERRPRDSERRPRDSERRPRDSEPRRLAEFSQQRRPPPREYSEQRRRGGGGETNMPPPPSRTGTVPPMGGLISRPTPGRPASSWDAVTPAPRARDDADEPLNSATTSSSRPDDANGDNDDDSFDRQFYLQEDEGHYVQDAQDGEDLGRFLYDSAKMQEREKEMEQRRQNRMNLRQAARQDDQDAWEENRLRVSGATAQGEVSLDISMDQDSRVTLLVHQVKPPFLDGRVSFSKIRDAVPTVKDASSDFAKMAREGSETLRSLRAKKEKNTMRQKFWELGGTRMGEAVGIKKEVKTEQGSTETETADGEIDYKKSSGFAEHVKSQKDGAVSKFAKEKSIRQQREYLPVFTVRDELLNVIRENNVVIIVGETGSGKVC